MGSNLVQQMSSLPLVALHGFLGRPEDFQLFSDGSLWPLDYFGSSQLGPHVSWQNWADLFWQQKNLPEKINLLGYSLGGRLALNAFAYRPERVEKLILISAGIWPLSLVEKEIRKQSDLAWAEKIKNLPWASLLKEWNAQTVFAGSQMEPAREEGNYSREKLALAMTNWSPNQMPDYTSILREFSSKVSLVCGELDQKYQQKFRECFARKMCREIYIVPRSGHRVIFDQPQLLFKVVREVLESN